MILWNETAKNPKLNLGFATADGRALLVILIGMAGLGVSFVIFKLSLVFFLLLVVLDTKGLSFTTLIRMGRLKLSGGMIRTASHTRRRS